MSLAQTERWVYERLQAGSQALLILVLDGVDPDWADAHDGQGRAALYVGRAQLPPGKATRQLLEVVREALARGTISEGQAPEGIRCVAYAPQASRALVEIVSGDSVEILVDGPRGTGKTQMTPGALAALAELHARAGHPLPLKALWLHDSLKSAGAKTARSLEQPLWSGLWGLRDDRSIAELTVGGARYVQADFVAVQDPTAQERLKAECHVVLAEEVVPSLTDGVGVPMDKYALALTSARLRPTRRRVGIVVTNPGAPDSWPALRFGLEGHAGMEGCVRRPIDVTDRLTPEEVAQMRASLAADPETFGISETALSARLVGGEWVELQLGEQVGVGYRPAVHVAPERLEVSEAHALVIGWDGGHSPSAVIGQQVGQQIRIYASLNSLKVGVLELIEDQVLPWLLTWAPHFRTRGMLTHVIDPSMRTAGQATIRESAEKVIIETLRGWTVLGPVAWPPRRESILRALAPRLQQGQIPLRISPVKETDLLRRALAGRWYYGQSPDGRVDRSKPKKPNSPWADIGDAAAYLCAFLAPSSGYGAPRGLARPTFAASATSDVLGDRRRTRPARAMAASSTSRWE